MAPAVAAFKPLRSMRRYFLVTEAVAVSTSGIAELW